jgi:hypothetical protein
MNEEPGGGGIDPSMLLKLTRLWSAYNGNDDDQKFAILKAVKPYLRPERSERMDRALQTLRLARVAREALGADLLGSLLSGGKR